MDTEEKGIFQTEHRFLKQLKNSWTQIEEKIDRNFAFKKEPNELSPLSRKEKSRSLKNIERL